MVKESVYHYGGYEGRECACGHREVSLPSSPNNGIAQRFYDWKMGRADDIIVKANDDGVVVQWNWVNAPPPKPAPPQSKAPRKVKHLTLVKG